MLGATWTPEDQEPGETNNDVEDLASSGSELYAAVGAGGIHVRDTGGTWTHYNDVEATRLAWLKDRLIAGDGTKVYEVISGATPTEMETLPSGWTFESFFEAGNFIYGCAINTTAVKSVEPHDPVDTGLSRPVVPAAVNRCTARVDTRSHAEPICGIRALERRPY